MFATLALPATCDGHALPPLAKIAVRSADDLRSALRQSRNRPTMLDATRMDRVLRIDQGRGVVEVQAAIPWSALAAHPSLAALRLEAFASAPDLPRTVGESVDANSAGPDGNPCSHHVVALVLVSPEGDLRRADRASNPELFRLVLGGQGAFGVLYSVTLSLASLRASAAAAQAPVELRLAQPDQVPGPACQIELLLPPEQVDPFLAQLRALAVELRLALHRVSVRGTQPEAETRLRWATRRWAAVRVCFGTRSSLGAAVHAAQSRRSLLELALACGGSFPIGDLRDATRAQLDACYPGLSAFLAEQRRRDPGALMQNAWLRQARAVLRGERCASRWSS